MQNRYRALLKRAGVPYRNFHALRHTYATRCIEQNVDVKSVSEMLGHSDVRITLQTYVHVSLRHKQQAVQSICFLPPLRQRRFCAVRNSVRRSKNRRTTGAQRRGFPK